MLQNRSGDGTIRESQLPLRDAVQQVFERRLDSFRYPDMDLTVGVLTFHTPALPSPLDQEYQSAVNGLIGARCQFLRVAGQSSAAAAAAQSSSSDAAFGIAGVCAVANKFLPLSTYIAVRSIEADPPIHTHAGVDQADAAGLEHYVSEVLKDVPLDSTRAARISKRESSEMEEIALCLFRYSNRAYSEVLQLARGLTPEKRSEIRQFATSRAHGLNLLPSSADEFWVDILTDVATLLDMQAQYRRPTFAQEYTVIHGFSVAADISDYGMEEPVISALTDSVRVFKKMSLSPVEAVRESAPYALPLATRKRVLFSMDLKCIASICQRGTMSVAHDGAQILKDLSSDYAHLK